MHACLHRQCECGICVYSVLVHKHSLNLNAGVMHPSVSAVLLTKCGSDQNNYEDKIRNLR